MIETLLADEMREVTAEAFALAHFPKAPPPATERIERELSKASKPEKGRPGRGGLSLDRARLMEADAAAYDAGLAKGQVEG